jgi:hypothetical protein
LRLQDKRRRLAKVKLPPSRHEQASQRVLSQADQVSLRLQELRPLQVKRNDQASLFDQVNLFLPVPHRLQVSLPGLENH